MYQHLLMAFSGSLLLLLLVKSHTGPIHRNAIMKMKNKRLKRGLLSKTGICPFAESNTQIKENRLNYFGQAVILPGEEMADCFQSECRIDGDCEADKKCCKNHCGAFVCSTAVRDPHPCELMNCPEDMICKIERVHCQMPYCRDLYARSRPSCVQSKDYYAKLERKRSKVPLVEDQYMPDSSEVQFIPKEPYKIDQTIFRNN